MAYEIERKFLVTSEDFKKQASSKEYIVQAFLNRHPERSVRVRIKDQEAFLTIKGISNESGTIRREWEYKIPVLEAEEMLKLCEPGAIQKYRYNIPVEDHVFEVDVFEGENQGLIVAEIELSAEEETFLKPTWLGEEVTGNKAYYNSYLSQNPFNTWE